MNFISISKVLISYIFFKSLSILLFIIFQYFLPSISIYSHRFNKIILAQIILFNSIKQMIQFSTSLAQLPPQLTYFFYFLLLAIIYLIYRTIFKGMVFKTVGNYDIKLKNIGRPLPAYPNGWYVALRSVALENGKSEAVDIAGQNIVVFRSNKGVAYALQAYCKHLGANLGIGGKVVNQKCIQCPFHGWLYDGESGVCVDHDGKPMEVLNVQYNEDFCQQGKKLNWVKKQNKTTSLRKYPVSQMNGYIYVWIHALPEHQEKPIYPMIDFSPIMSSLEYRATTIHDVRSHVQDIPENGADIFHFKYVHSEIIPKVQLINFLWKAKWKRGDDPNLAEIFQHDVKFARDFKQRLYKQFIEKYPRKEFLSVGYIDNYLKIPIFGYKFCFNVTILQLGCSTVFIFLRSPVFTIVLCHYLNPKEKYRQIVYHDGYTSTWLPYWASAFAVKMQGNQVTNDMFIWDAKKFGRSICLKKGEEADVYLKNWREWYSQHYEGCKDKEKNGMNW